MVNSFGIVIVFVAMMTRAASSIGYKFALGSKETEDRDPLSSLGIRIIIVFVVVLVITLIIGNLGGIFQLSSNQASIYWPTAFIGTALILSGDITYFYAFRYIDSSRVFPLTNTQTLFTFPIAFLLFNESILPTMWIAAGFMIIGVFFMGNRDAQDKGMEKLDPAHQKKNHLIGVTLGILTGFFFATQYLALNEMNHIFYSPFANNLVCIFLYFIAFWIYLLITRKHIPSFKKTNKEQWRAYLIAGLFGALAFGIGDAIYQIGAILNGNAISIIIASSSPIFNQIMAILFLKEKFRPTFLIGIVCIIIGNLLVI